MDISGNRDSQLVSLGILKNLTDSTLNTSAGSLFQNGAAQTLKVY